MAVAVDPNETIEYVLTAERTLPKEQQTIWKLGALDSRLRRYLSDRSTRISINNKGGDAPADIQIDVNTKNYSIARFGIRGWENFSDGKGGLVECETVKESLPNVGERFGLTHPIMDRIEPFVDELADAINKANKLSGEQEKNSK